MASAWGTSWGTSWADSWGATGGAAPPAGLKDVSGSGHRKGRGRRKDYLSPVEPERHFKVTGDALRQLVYLHLEDVIREETAVIEAEAPKIEIKRPVEAAKREKTPVKPGPSPEYAILAKRIVDLEERLARADLAEVEAAVAGRLEEIRKDEEDIAILLLFI